MLEWKGGAVEFFFLATRRKDGQNLRHKTLEHLRRLTILGRACNAGHTHRSETNNTRNGTGTGGVSCLRASGDGGGSGDDDSHLRSENPAHG